MRKSYWVSAINGEDMGDYGGFSFDTWEDAQGFVRQTYADELRLVEDGYYESQDEVQLLSITVLIVESVHDQEIVAAALIPGEPNERRD